MSAQKNVRYYHFFNQDDGSISDRTREDEFHAVSMVNASDHQIALSAERERSKGLHDVLVAIEPSILPTNHREMRRKAIADYEKETK